MPKQSKPKAKRRAPKSTAAGRALLASLNQALAYARGEHVPGIRVTYVQVDRPTPFNGCSPEARPKPVQVRGALRIHTRDHPQLGAGPHARRWSGSELSMSASSLLASLAG
jgi:hypothetical protein